MRPVVPIVAIVLLSAAALADPLAAAPRSGDALIVAESTLAHAGERVDVLVHGDVDVDPGFVHVAERALAQMEAVLGRGLDTETLGPRLQIHVSTSTRVSHVWRGYEHPGDPRGMLFLNPKVLRLGMAGRNATYAHELAHLLTWRFSSHSLREGLADHLALRVHPGADVGPNAAGAPLPIDLDPQIAARLGTTQPPPAAVTEDAAFRAAYYLASRRFVDYLIGRAGMETFLRLYDAADPEALYEPLYGAARDVLVRAALDPASAKNGVR